MRLTPMECLKLASIFSAVLLLLGGAGSLDPGPVLVERVAAGN